MAGFVERVTTAGRAIGRAGVRTVQFISPQVRRILIGLFLIAAFSATGAVLLFVITAEQLQSQISSPDLASAKTSIGSIRQDVAQIEHYYAVIGGVTKKEVDANESLFTLSAKTQAALAKMSASADDTIVFINQNTTNYIKPPLRPTVFPWSTDRVRAPTAPAPAALPSQDDMNPQVGASPSPVELPASATAPQPPPAVLQFADTVAGYFESYQSALEQAAGNSDGARSSLAEFRTDAYLHLKPYAQARSDYDAAESEIQSLKAQLGALKQRENELDDAVAPKDSALHKSDAYWNLCEDFFSFKSLVGDRAYNIVLFPKMMLVLMLSIFMGVLGSLIYISQDFLKNPDGRGFWDILFRIGLGAGVAFALFFFAAAGMLALSQNSAGSQTDMSPYLISFLGITGGYLSDRVTEWMREVGENTFKVEAGGPPKRWAVGLADALKTASLDTTALASAANVTPADAADWASLAQPVPGDKQAIVAAFLRIHPSRVFTDIAPG